MNRVRTYISKDRFGNIKLPMVGDVALSISVGQIVKKGDLLYKIRQRKLFESYYLPKVLGVRVENVREYIGRVAGEYVMKGELLAEKLVSGGMISKRITATTEGVVSLERIDQGFLDIVGEYENVEVYSDYGALIEQISLNSFITLKVSVDVMQYTIAKNISSTQIDLMGEASGVLKVLGDGESIFHVNSLEESYEGKIVFTGRHLNSDLAVELYKRGAIAIITYSMEYQDFKEISVPTLVLVGFGNLRVNQSQLAIIKSYDGKTIKIESERNELHLVKEKYSKKTDEVKDKIFAGELKVGDRVVLQDGERFGLEAKILSLNESNLRDEGFISVEIEGGGNALVHENSVEVLRL